MHLVEIRRTICNIPYLPSAVRMVLLRKKYIKFLIGDALLGLMLSACECSFSSVTSKKAYVNFPFMYSDQNGAHWRLRQGYYNHYYELVEFPL